VTRERNGNRWAVKIQINNARRSSSPKRDLSEETIVLPLNATPASRAKLTSPFSRGISAQPTGGRHVIIKSAYFPPADIALATLPSICPSVTAGSRSDDGAFADLIFSDNEPLAPTSTLGCIRAGSYLDER